MNATRAGPAPCTNRKSCDALSQALPEDVVWPNSTTYALRNAYYSGRQAELHPRCFVTPRDTAAVSTAVRTLISHNEPFTVRCGGHTSFQGSNIGDGVTVDLVYLNDVSVAPDNTSVSIGANNRWYNVSRALDPLGSLCTRRAG